MRSSHAALGFALVGLGAVLFTINAGVSLVALRAGVDARTLTTVRVTGTAAGLLVVAALFRRSALRPPGGRLGLLVVVLGVVGVAGLQWTYFVAIDRLPMGLALLLEYQAPILVALWARFVQHERVRPRAWVGLALAWIGLVAATGIGRGASLDRVGLLAGLGAALCFATYFLVGEHGVGRLDPIRVVLWSFVVASVAMNLVAPITRLPASLLGDRAGLQGALAAGRTPVWALLVWIVVLGTLVPFAAELTALRRLRATTVTLVAMLEPIGVNVLGWAWFHQGLGTVAIIGGLAVVGGVLLAQSARRDPVLIEPPTPG